jgi:anti-sigma B factor antagonist
MTLAISSRRIGGVVVVDCSGRILLGSELTSLRIAVKEFLNKSRQIVLDIGGVTYIDSSGLGALVGLYASARNSGGEIKLANLSPHLKDMLQITKLFTVFEVFDRAEDAAAAFSKAAGA